MEMKDSGKRQQFGSGAVRDTAEGKAEMHFLAPCVWPLLVDVEEKDMADQDCQAHVGLQIQDYLRSGSRAYTEAALTLMLKAYGVERLCNWLTKGAQKYAAYNWAQGMPSSRCLDSLGRHLCQWIRGDEDEDHVAAAMCNLMFILHFHDTSWNDLPVYSKIMGENDAEKS